MRPIAASSPATPPPPVSQRTPWHSPVPYLFGGLAAMLGLIAFALLILACSYWKLSIQSEERERDLERENGQNQEKKNNSGEDNETKVYEEKILVIMAGDQKPTFLATPVTAAKFSSFTDSNVSDRFKLHNAQKQTGEICGKVKEISHHENDEEEEEEEA